MSELVDLRRQVDRWKDKYFTQGEQFEADKKLAQEYASLLQRLLIRISLAAESVSDELDRELDGLRNAIRKATPEENDLEKRLKRIDKLILDTDESKHENAGKVLDSLKTLIDQLLSIDLPRKQKSGLKSLSKSLKGRVSHFQEYPGILSEYAILQAEALRQVVGDEKKEEGFFSRLLGGKSDSEKQIDSSDSACDEFVEITEAEADIEVITGEGDFAKEEFIPGYASISAHVRVTLSNLLDQLVFPTSADRDVEKLRNKLGSKLNWYELGPMLDDLSNLVISVVGKGQREFETFLLLLEERLEKVQGYIANSQQADQAWLTKNKEFDRAMRDQVSEMSKELVQLTDIEDLKSSITNHLDSISDVMLQHADEGVQYERNKESEVLALKERLELMEKESAEIKKQLKEERSKALLDGLTELPNREAYDERLDLELARFKRYGKAATLVVGDVDHFKSVNDTYGHLSGDKVLQIIAKELRNRTRKTDFVARYGGEEFAIILPETDIETATTVINKTREMISRLPFHFKDERVQITMSFGLVAFAKDLEKADLFEKADKALYQAKENGRNCLEIAS